MQKEEIKRRIDNLKAKANAFTRGIIESWVLSEDDCGRLYAKYYKGQIGCIKAIDWKENCLVVNR